MFFLNTIFIFVCQIVTSFSFRVLINPKPSIGFSRFHQNLAILSSRHEPPTVGGDEGEDDNILYVSENELKDIWKKKKPSNMPFDERQAMLLYMEENDDDDEDDYIFGLASDMPTEDRTTVHPPRTPMVRRDVPVSVSVPGKNKEGRSVGIDLGTTNSVVSVMEGGVPVVIPIHGSKILPSVVSYRPMGEVVVGELARRQLVMSPMSTYASVKRVIGRSVKQLKTAGERLSPMKVDPNLSDAVDGLSLCRLLSPKWPGVTTPSVSPTALHHHHHHLRPENVSAEILRELVQGASEYIGHAVTRAVVTVPAYFLPAQCDATRRAAEQAGIEKVKLLREPEAAALAYGLREKQQQLVMVFDLGGGTFDVSVLEVGGGFVEVLATSGDGHLGGDDFDSIVGEWIETQYLEQNRGNITTKGAVIAGDVGVLRSDPVVVSRIRDAAEKARIELSSLAVTEINLPMLQGSLGLRCVLTRSRLESLCQPLLGRILRPLREVCLMAGVNLSGESGQFGFTSEEFDGEESRGLAATAPPLEGEGGDRDIGGGVEGRKQKQEGGRSDARKKQKMRGSSGKELRRLQKQLGDPSISPFPTGMEVNQVLLVGGATRMPMVRRLVRAVTGKDPRQAVDPDLAVSLGAAVYAGIMDGEVAGLDVMSAWQAAMYRAFYQDQQQQLKQQPIVMDGKKDSIKGDNNNNNNHDRSDQQQQGDMVISAKVKTSPSSSSISSSSTSSIVDPDGNDNKSRIASSTTTTTTTIPSSLPSSSSSSLPEVPVFFNSETSSSTKRKKSANNILLKRRSQTE
eukprot:gene2652-5208_t